MLTIWPQLLFLSPLSATLLRIVAGLVFAYVALQQYHRRETIAGLKYLFVPGGMWIVWTMTVIEIATALSLILGYKAQIGALIGALLALKYCVWHRSYREMFPLSIVSSLLLLAICVSVLVTGAGIFAFDLPL